MSFTSMTSQVKLTPSGNKGDVDHGLGKLRDVVWNMTQQLLKKKQAGKLVLGPEKA